MRYVDCMGLVVAIAVAVTFGQRSPDARRLREKFGQTTVVTLESRRHTGYTVRRLEVELPTQVALHNVRQTGEWVLANYVSVPEGEELRLVDSSRNGRNASLRYEQTHNGLPVWGGFVHMHLKGKHPVIPSTEDSRRQVSFYS
jgi:hypothetical protein